MNGEDNFATGSRERANTLFYRTATGPFILAISNRMIEQYNHSILYEIFSVQHQKRIDHRKSNLRTISPKDIIHPREILVDLMKSLIYTASIVFIITTDVFVRVINVLLTSYWYRSYLSQSKTITTHFMFFKRFIILSHVSIVIYKSC